MTLPQGNSFQSWFWAYFVDVSICFPLSSSRRESPADSDNKESACNAGDLGQEDPLEKGKAIHSSVLAWRTSCTEMSGGLQSIGSQESDTTGQLHSHATETQGPRGDLRTTSSDVKAQRPEVPMIHL